MGGFKFKNRYLVCQITFKDGRGLTNNAHTTSTSQTSSTVMLRAVRESLGTLFGDVGRGASLASCQVKYVHEPSGIFLIRCNRDACRDVWLALTCIGTVDMRVCRCDVLQTSGSLTSSLRCLKDVIGDDDASIDDLTIDM